MMKKTFFTLVFLFTIQFTLLAAPAKRAVSFNLSYAASLYEDISFQEEKPDLNALYYGTLGYYHLEEQGKITNHILSIVDFSLSANEKRMWVINMDTKEVLFHTLVSHGRNSGEEYATSFSNNDGSHKSSLGFYLTEDIYNGKHDESLRLDGLERGYNSNARARGVVIHGADYVSQQFIHNNGRLGRSHGCPALPQDLNTEIVNTIKDKSCLFLYYPDSDYISNSPILNEIKTI